MKITNRGDNPEEGSYTAAFGGESYKKSWARFNKIVDAMPFEDELEAEDWKERLKDDKKLRYAMLKDLTPKFRKMLAARLKPKRNYIIMFCGPMGSGKSISECQVCWETKLLAPTSEYRIVMGIDEIRTTLPTLPPHGIAVNDEDLIITGPGSDTAAKHTANQLKFAREGEKNLMLSAKWYVNVHIANYYVEMFGFNAETGESRFLLRGRTGRWLGVVTLKRTFSDEFYRPFVEAKQKADERLTKSKGETGAFADFDLKQSATYIEQLLREKCFTSTRKTLIRAFITQQAELDDNQSNAMLHVPKILMSDLIARIQVNLICNPIKKIKEEKEISTIDNGAIQRHELIKELQFDEFLSRIYKELERAGVEPIKLQVFKLKCENNSNLDISRLLNIATGSVFNYHSEILRNFLGYATELAFAAELDEEGADYTHGGFNSPDPDFLLRTPISLLPIDLIPCIISLKGYFIFRIHKALSEIAASEIAYAHTHNWPLLEICYEAISGTLRIFRLFLGDKTNLQSSSSCESRNEKVMNTPSPEPPLLPAGPPPPPTVPPPTGGAGSAHNCESRNKIKKKRRRRQ